MSTTPAGTTGPTAEDRSAGSSVGGEFFDDTFFGRVVTEQRLATPEEVAACIAKQKELEKSGTKMPLSELMVRAGFLTPSQIKRLSRGMDDSMTRPAQQIPGFQIIKRVGAGAMATVYMAKQLSLDRVVAIKVLPRRMGENREFVDRFYKEGRAAAKLNHNNIVQAIDVGEHAGFHYFVMEFIDGKTVYDDLVKNRVYPEPAAIDVILQVARALEHAHQRRLIHRDVKPKNIMITKQGVAKLADMGLAREAGDRQAAVAEAGRAYGTPYYIAPEQIRGEANIDFRVDIYSLGATFYHMVTGRVPFDGPTPAAVMHKHLREPLTPPDHINPKLSSGLAEVIEVMMAKDRDHRYPSTTDLIKDLDSVSRGQAPVLARQRYDAAVLERLADGTVSEDGLPDEAGAVGGGGRGLLIWLSVGLGASLLLNLILLAWLAAQ